MTRNPLFILLVSALLLAATANSVKAQQQGNDSIRLGAVTEAGVVYPMVLLPEYTVAAMLMDHEERNRRAKLRNDIYVTYPYALAAATIYRDVNKTMEKIDGRRDRKRYLKSIDKQLGSVFKDQLKNMSIDQGHVLIKLVGRQTGENCYSIIRDLKGGLSAVLWQGVGVLFNNNLNRDYDPEGRDKEIEAIVKDLEASTSYRYQLYQQEALLKKAGRPQQ